MVMGTLQSEGAIIVPPSVPTGHKSRVWQPRKEKGFARMLRRRCFTARTSSPHAFAQNPVIQQSRVCFLRKSRETLFCSSPHGCQQGTVHQVSPSSVTRMQVPFGIVSTTLARLSALLRRFRDPFSVMTFAITPAVSSCLTGHTKTEKHRRRERSSMTSASWFQLPGMCHMPAFESAASGNIVISRYILSCTGGEINKGQ